MAPGEQMSSPSAVTRPAPRPQGPVAALVAVVTALGLLPLIGERSFYYWDDTAAVFIPTWHAIGAELWAGHWPTLRPDLWMGGNWAAEAQFGLWSPANLLGALVISRIPHLALGATLAKLTAMLLLTGGAYLVIRQYRVSPWLSAAVASALPFAGFTLYFDAATWVAGLLAFAWTPWFWWAARRCLYGRSSLPMYVVGYLAITNGNPYGVVAVLVLLTALAVEALVARRWVGLVRLTLVGAAVGTAVGVTFLPNAATAGTGWRPEVSGLANNGELVPDLTMLAGTSSPSMLPLLDMWGQQGSTVPATYTAWFLLPLLPWLRWEILRRRARELTTAFVVLGTYLVLVLGPSDLWLFRWPLRLVPYAFLASSVLLAVLLAHGLRTDHWRVRVLVSGAIVAFGGWLALAGRPDLATRHTLGTLIVAALVAVSVMTATHQPRAVPSVLIVGTGVVLVVQLTWVPSNHDVMLWKAPTRLASFEEYAAAHAGPVVQLADAGLIPVQERTAAAAELLFGSQPALAGVESTTSYSGIGFDTFAGALCLNHAGNACPGAFPALWEPAGTAVPTPLLLDALKARTVVVQNALVPRAATFDPPSGWIRTLVDQRVSVFTRVDVAPWPHSRLAATSGTLTVRSAIGTDTEEHLVVRTGASGGAVQFARLAWPGYQATLNGHRLPVRQNAQGLIEVILPADVENGALTLGFSPPGYDVAIPVLLLGLAVAAATAIAEGVWGRRTRSRTRANSLGAGGHGSG